MRKLFYLVQKEFIQIFRNKAILPLMTVVPIMQLIILSFAASNEVKNVQLAIVNQDNSEYSRLLTSKIKTSDRFIIMENPPSVKVADGMMQSGNADIILTIPPQFEKNFYKNKKILITGGTGSLGKALIKKLKKYDCELIVYSRAEVKQALSFGNVSSIIRVKGDVRDLEKLDVKMKRHKHA